MKVTICVLIAALCLAGANASQPRDLEYVPANFAEDTVDIDNFTVFSSFYRVAKAALTTVKGLNCTIKEVIAVKTAAQDFVDNIQSCGTDAVAAFADVITSVQSVIDTCDNIINLNEQVCNTDDSTSDKTSSSCVVKVLAQLTTLKKQIKNTLSAIKKVPSVPADAADCTNNTVNELTTAFTSFPANIKACSKLTSK